VGDAVGAEAFLGDSDYQTVKLVQQANIPSLRKINPDVPEALDSVLMKSLAKDKNVRYKSAQAFAEDLAQFLFSFQTRVTASTIAKMVREDRRRAEGAGEERGQARRGVDHRSAHPGRARPVHIARERRCCGCRRRCACRRRQAGSIRASMGDGSKPLSDKDFVNLSDFASEALGNDFDPSVGNATSGWSATGVGYGATANLAD